MKKLGIITLFAVLSCSPREALAPPASPDTPPEVCNAPPPEEFGPGYMNACQDEGSKTCCGYAFLTSLDEVCIHILCRMDSCQPWEYVSTICPPPEKPFKRGKTINYDANEDEGWYEEA